MKIIDPGPELDETSTSPSSLSPDDVSSSTVQTTSRVTMMPKFPFFDSPLQSSTSSIRSHPRQFFWTVAASDASAPCTGGPPSIRICVPSCVRRSPVSTQGPWELRSSSHATLSPKVSGVEDDTASRGCDWVRLGSLKSARDDGRLKTRRGRCCCCCWRVCGAEFDDECQISRADRPQEKSSTKHTSISDQM